MTNTTLCGGPSDGNFDRWARCGGCSDCQCSDCGAFLGRSGCIECKPAATPSEPPAGVHDLAAMLDAEYPDTYAATSTATPSEGVEAARCMGTPGRPRDVPTLTNDFDGDPFTTSKCRGCDDCRVTTKWRLDGGFSGRSTEGALEGWQRWTDGHGIMFAFPDSLIVSMFDVLLDARIEETEQSALDYYTPKLAAATTREATLVEALKSIRGHLTRATKGDAESRGFAILDALHDVETVLTGKGAQDAE